MIVMPRALLKRVVRRTYRKADWKAYCVAMGRVIPRREIVRMFLEPSAMERAEKAKSNVR